MAKLLILAVKFALYDAVIAGIKAGCQTFSEKFSECHGENCSIKDEKANKK